MENKKVSAGTFAKFISCSNSATFLVWNHSMGLNISI